jgi:hypothetical protein
MRVPPLIKDPRSVPIADLRGAERLLAVAVRNLYWGHTQGWGNLLEEHDLNLAVRVPREMRKWVWRRRFGVEGQACPVFVVGAQRSGTNMVTYGLQMAPEFAVYNEGNSRAFANYRLRDPAHIAQLITRSRHRFVLFKPLLDSHRILDLLEGYEGSAKALWVYRGVRERVRSAVAKFGDSNLRVLLRRHEPGFQHWQLGGLSEESRALLDRFDTRTLTPADGAALFWLIRNRLFFELSLHERRDALLVSYDSFIVTPEPAMRRVSDFLDFPYRPALIAHVRPQRSRSNGDSDIKPEILECCDALMERLDRTARG